MKNFTLDAVKQLRSQLVLGIVNLVDLYSFSISREAVVVIWVYSKLFFSASTNMVVVRVSGL